MAEEERGIREMEIFESSIREKGDLAGVFEFDGTTAYFYLCSTSDGGGGKVLDHIHVYSSPNDLSKDDVSVRWDEDGVRVGLFLRDIPWAIFNSLTGQKFGGEYVPGGRPVIPPSEKF